MKSNDLKSVNCTINGKPHTFLIGKGPGKLKPSSSLADVLRDMLLLTGTKTPCNKGECGGCTVLINGKPMLSCTTLIAECDDYEIVTIEGLRDDLSGDLHPLQQAFIDLDAIQCGMCTPGITLTAKALLDRIPNPTKTQVCEALSGNICRCSGYEKYVEGVLLAAERINQQKEA